MASDMAGKLMESAAKAMSASGFGDLLRKVVSGAVGPVAAQAAQTVAAGAAVAASGPPAGGWSPKT
jgi:hypothetical protein